VDIVTVPSMYNVNSMLANSQGIVYT
jgi:hypothetical protein